MQRFHTTRWVGLLVLIVVATVVSVLERMFPFEPSWNQPRGDLNADIFHTWISSIGTSAAFHAAFFPAIAEARGALAVATWWPAQLPFFFQCLAALLVAELGGYLSHRAMHHTCLWRFHKLHHSAPRIYYLNAARNHPVDALLTVASSTVPLAWLGAPPEVMALLGAFAGLHGLLQHANLDYRLGPLSWLLSVGEVHRWHHSRDLKEASANYGNLILLYDLLFGTRRVPAGRPPVEVGLAEENQGPSGILEQLTDPFRR